MPNWRSFWRRYSKGDCCGARLLGRALRRAFAARRSAPAARRKQLENRRRAVATSLPSEKKQVRIDRLNYQARLAEFELRALLAVRPVGFIDAAFRQAVLDAAIAPRDTVV